METERDLKRALIDRWTAEVAKIPSVVAAWLEGSVARGDDSPGSDIDIIAVIEDAAYDRLWNQERARLLAPLGECLTLHNQNFTRVLTREGFIVELGAHPLGKVPEISVFDARFLFERTPLSGYTPIHSPVSGSEAWPLARPLDANRVRGVAHNFLHAMAKTPRPFYHGEPQSALFVLDRTRMDLTVLMYWQRGVRFAKRHKRFSEVLTQEHLRDLRETRLQAGESPDDLAAVARAYLRSFRLAGKLLAALSEKVGGGFEAEWHGRLLEQTEQRLAPFLQGDQPGAEAKA